MEDELKIYEASFLIEEPRVADEILGWLNNIGAELVLNKEANKIDLAYPVKKRRQSFFWYVYFKMPSSSIENFQKFLRQNQKILRFMIIRDPFIRKIEKAPFREKPSKIITRLDNLTNEEIEKKIEEILEKSRSY